MKLFPLPAVLTVMLIAACTESRFELSYGNTYPATGRPLPSRCPMIDSAKHLWTSSFIVWTDGYNVSVLTA